MARYRDRRDRERSAGCFLRVLLLLAFLALIGLAFATFWTGATPRVAVQPGLKGIGKRTPIQVRIEDPQRVEKVKVELLQGSDVKPVAEKTFTPEPAWKAWGGPEPVQFSVDVGRDTIKGLRAGEA